MPLPIIRAVSGRYQLSGHEIGADAILGLSFGLRREVDGELTPGLSNEDLAQFLVSLELRTTQLPKILQWEIANAYRLLCPEDRRVHRIEWDGTEPYLDTYSVVEQADQLMRQHGWHRPLLLAHAHHLPRVTAVVRRFGYTPIVIEGLRQVRFDPESNQWWTRSPLLWPLRELPALAYFRWKKWV